MMRPNELTPRHRGLTAMRLVTCGAASTWLGYMTTLVISEQTTVAEVAAGMAEVEALVVVAISLSSSWSEHDVEHLVGVAKLTSVSKVLTVG